MSRKVSSCRFIDLAWYNRGGVWEYTKVRNRMTQIEISALPGERFSRPAGRKWWGLAHRQLWWLARAGLPPISQKPTGTCWWSEGSNVPHHQIGRLLRRRDVGVGNSPPGSMSCVLHERSGVCLGRIDKLKVFEHIQEVAKGWLVRVVVQLPAHAVSVSATQTTPPLLASSEMHSNTSSLSIRSSLVVLLYPAEQRSYDDKTPTFGFSCRVEFFHADFVLVASSYECRLSSPPRMCRVHPSSFEERMLSREEALWMWLTLPLF